MLKSTKSKKDSQKIKDELDLLEGFCKREKKHLMGDIEMERVQRKLKERGYLKKWRK